MERAAAEHELVKQILGEMENQDGEELEKTFQALTANVQLHVPEEENEIFPRVNRADGELDLRKIGEQLSEEKRKYSGNGETEFQTRDAGGDKTSKLWDMTVDELYERAKHLDIHCRSNMRKDELIEAIEDKGDDLNQLSKDELTKKARELDIHGRSNMNRHQLVRAIRDRQ